MTNEKNAHKFYIYTIYHSILLPNSNIFCKNIKIM